MGRFTILTLLIEEKERVAEQQKAQTKNACDLAETFVNPSNLPVNAYT
jgi:hypothetical protein